MDRELKNLHQSSDKINSIVSIFGDKVYKLFTFIIFVALIVAPLLGQSGDTLDKSENNKSTQESNQSKENENQVNEKLEKLLKYIVILEKYGPKTMEKEFIRKGFGAKLLKGIRNSLLIVSNQMLSSLDTLEYVRDSVSNDLNLRGIDFYRLDFGFEKDYFKEIIKHKKVRHNYFFDKNLKFLYQIENVLEDNSDLLIQSFGEGEIYPLIFETKYFIGNILILKGMSAYLRQAKEKFEYILGKNKFNREFIPNDDFRKKIYMVMLDIYDRLFYDIYYINTDFWRMIVYSREKLSYLWKIIDINHDDQAIKDIKYRRLYTTYAPIMDPKSPNYISLYSKHRKDGDVYPVIEEEKEDEADQKDKQEQQENSNTSTTEKVPPSSDESGGDTNGQ